jgi:multidrug efflux pump subunit AcrA (membrane-fusion protein)
MTDRPRASWLVYTLGVLCIGAIVAAFLVVGPSSQSATTQSRTVTVAEGVVQSTVSGSGNLQAVSQLNLGFKTSGVVDHIYVTQGEHVSSGQLLATLNPQSAEVSLEQAKATLEAAEASLAQEEESGGETTAGAGAAKASTAAMANTAAFNGPTGPSGSSGSTGTTTTPAGAPIATTTTTTSAAITTRPAVTTATKSTAAPRTVTSTERSTTVEKTKQSAATRDANLASARAAVKSDKLAVQGAEQSVADTKLYAPGSGTIVSLSGEVGETVSGGGTSKASSSTASSSAGGSSSAAGAGAATTSRAATTSGSSSSGSGSSSTSSTAFAVLSDLSAMQLVVPLSESEIPSVKVGQPATITIEALEGRKLAAEVVSVATLSTSNSGVVSYDVTFQLDQLTAGLKPGMSASAEVVVKQAEGVNVPTTAISGGSVTVIEGEKRVRRTVLTGLAGNSSTIILNGLKAGERVSLPITSTSSATSLTSKLGGRTGSGLGGGGFGGGLGGGGGAFRPGG